MDVDFNLLFVLSLGWILMVFQYIIPGIARIGAPERTLLKKKDYTNYKDVAVLLPCFNEGPHAYETIKSICESDYPKKYLQIIAVDDCSTDDSWIWIQRAVADFGKECRLTAFRQPENAGKQNALLRGANIATDAEILICIDSDCIFDKRAVSEIIASFTHDRVGGVGGQVRVSNVNENFLTQAQALHYFYSFDVMKMFENYLRNVICISGCLFAIRRKAFFEMEPQLRDCNFLGVKFTVAEDKLMTHMLMLNGYETFINLDAYCWTEVPSTFAKFFNQQWRWRRAGIFDYILTFKTMGRHIRSMSLFSIINLVLPQTVDIVVIFSLFYAIAQNLFLQWVFLFQMMALAVLTPFIFAMVIRIRRVAPDQAPNTPVFVLMPLIAAWSLINVSLGTLLALFTMDSSSWGTRGSVGPKKDTP